MAIHAGASLKPSMEEVAEGMLRLHHGGQELWLCNLHEGPWPWTGGGMLEEESG